MSGQRANEPTPQAMPSTFTAKKRARGHLAPIGSTLLAAAGALAATGCGPSEPPLNVLLITLDTTRADRLSCYGYGIETTPHMDALAARGQLFERALSTAGITPMSHSSILTGLNNYRHGMRVFYSEEVSHRLKEEVDSLPEILGRRGYRTAAAVSSYPVSEVYNLDQGFDTFTTGVDADALDLTGQQRHEAFWQVGGSISTQRRGDLTVNDAIGWLDENGKDGEPWCMWVHMFDVHDYSLVPPLEYAERFGIDTYPDVDGKSNLWRERMYDPELAWLDDQVQRLVTWLEEQGQLDSTIIVITADHGQGLTDGLERHGWAKHRLLYDWSVHVPLIMHLPGEPAGVRVTEQVRTIDILPTLLQKLDVPMRQSVDGESVIGLVRGEKEPTPRIAYADALNKYDKHSPARGLPSHSAGDNLYMVCDGRWKLIYKELRGEHELFDLESDPLELRNLAAQNPEEVERLAEFLKERRAFDVEPPAGEDTGGPSSDALNTLGYVGDEEEESEEGQR